MAKSNPAAGSQLEDNLSSLSLGLDSAPPPAPEAPAAPAAAEPTPATAPAAQQPAPETPPVGADEPRLVPNVAARMREWGYEVDDTATDDDVRQHLESLEDRASKYEQSQQELEQLRQWRAQVEAQRQSEATAVPATAPAAPASAAAPAADELAIPDRPAFDPVTLGVLRVAKDNGLLKSGVGGFISSDDQSLRPYIEKYNAQVAAIEAYDAEWTPRKIAETLYEQRAAKDREEREALRKELESFKTAAQTDKLQSEIDSFFEKNKTAYFDLGPDGNPVWDPQRQTYVGDGYARYMAAAQEAQEFGITDPAAIHRYAVKHAPPAKVQERPAEKVVKFRNRLKNNGADTLSPTPVSRPAAAAATRSLHGQSFHQQLSSTFSNLMNETVGERP